MFDLQKIILEIEKGTLGIPEFQRDFDWSEADVRSLLVTVFSGWPAGSLLLLDGRQRLFHLRSFEGGPDVARDVSYIVLDGQQRLRSLYHSLRNKGRARYAIKWNISPQDDLDDAVVSYPVSVWEQKYGTEEQQRKAELIPVYTLLTATDFFQWRDTVLDGAEPRERSALKSQLTELYTYRISKIHDYEFPAVILERDTEPAAIARIFERVNRTGLKLGAFDLMVAKTFDPGWNLRDRWLDVQQKYPNIADFLEDDGMPILQAMALLVQGDLRQSAVLSMSKATVQKMWDEVAHSAHDAIKFLTDRCGVLRRDFMPYPNMLPPFIAAAQDGVLAENPALLERWFWYSGFSSQYNAAANTRLVSHFRTLRDGALPRLWPHNIMVNLLSANRQGERAVWASVVCYLSRLVTYDRAGDELMGALRPELEVGSLFSKGEIIDSGDNFFEERSALNAILVPRRSVPLSRKLPSAETVEYYRQVGLEPLIAAQVPPAQLLPYELIDFRTREMVAFLTSLGISCSVEEDIYGYFTLKAEEAGGEVDGNDHSE